jgi:membrane protein
MPAWAKATFKVAKNSVDEFLKDNCLNVAAAIAYYVLQSIIPLILGFIVIGSFFLQDGEARTNFINSVKGALPNLGAGFDIGTIIDSLVKGAPGLLSVSAVFLLWSGSGIFDQLIFGINVAYDVKKDNRNFFVKTGLRIALLLIVGALVAASFVITIVSQLIFSADVSLLGISPSNFSFILPVISILLPVLLMFCVFLILYKVAPDRKNNEWRYVAIGAAVAAVLFELLKYGFTLYLTIFNAADSYTKSYGALGGVLLFLFYIWICAAIMLFGAEIAAVAGGWKSMLEGPAALEDPGKVVPAEKLDSEAGPLVTAKEKRQGKDVPRSATQVDQKGADAAGTGQVKEAHKKAAEEFEESKDKAKGAKKEPQVVPAYAISTNHYPAKPDKENPVTLGVGLVALGLAAVAGIIFRRKDPAA